MIQTGYADSLPGTIDIQPFFLNEKFDNLGKSKLGCKDWIVEDNVRASYEKKTNVR
jgi:hypothetical protein